MTYPQSSPYILVPPILIIYFTPTQNFCNRPQSLEHQDFQLVSSHLSISQVRRRDIKQRNKTLACPVGPQASIQGRSMAPCNTSPTAKDSIDPGAIVSLTEALSLRRKTPTSIPTSLLGFALSVTQEDRYPSPLSLSFYKCPGAFPGPSF